MVNEATREKNIPVGKIDIMKSFSFFEIDNQFVEKVMSGLNSASFDGVKVSTEIANEKPQGDSGRGDRRPSGRDRSERKPFDRERPERRSFDRGRSERKSSDRERPEHKSFDRERPEWKQFDRDISPKRSESGKRPRTKKKIIMLR
ncbi:MAG: DbpA RNA binding domain-containing protein [Sphingobacterium sp.]|nr:DbpA RNA binding domain-containing protein [Sphingobacterium sp.]